MRMLRIAIGLVLGTAWLVAGCPRKVQDPVGDTAVDTMGLYAEGFNGLAGQMKILLDGFTRATAVSDGGTVPFARRMLPALQDPAQAALRDARNAFAAAQKSAPGPLRHLDPLADALIRAAQDLTSAYTDLQRYCDADGFELDDGRGGRELVSRLEGLARSYRDARAEIQTAFDGIETEQLAAEVKKREAAPDYGYWFRRFTLEGKRVLAVAKGTSDPAVFGPALAGLGKVSQGIAAHLKDRGEVPAAFRTYQDSAGRFLDAANRFAIALQAPAPDRKIIDAEYASLHASYNALIDAGNTLYEAEDRGLLK